MGIEAMRLPREVAVARPPSGEPGHLRTLKGVTLVREGQQLLKGIDLAINRGECLVILGPNGAGKTLLMRVAHRLLAPTQGSVSADPVREAMVFQRPVLLRRSVLDNVLYVLDHARLGPACGLAGTSTGAPRPFRTADRMARALAALRLVGLERLARRPARVLSGGEQQRVALARAAVVQPDLIWFDEPTANLDPASAQGIEAFVTRMSSEGVTCVM
ncbi:MAG: ATP-binding cassette domain-containing protein, partial [Lautropia sp.]